MMRENDIILKKSIPETALISEGSLAEDWLSPEDEEAWKEIEEGKGKTYSSMEEFIKRLKKDSES